MSELVTCPRCIDRKPYGECYLCSADRYVTKELAAAYVLTIDQCKPDNTIKHLYRLRRELTGLTMPFKEFVESGCDHALEGPHNE